MYNPFVALTERRLKGYRSQGNQYFVRQFYSRGIGGEENFKTAFLFTPYQDLQKAEAHFNEVSSDLNRFLYNATDPEHLRRLEIAAAGGHGFGVFMPFADKPWKPDQATSDKIKQYIMTNLRWRPRGYTQIKTGLTVRFGELFLVIQSKDQIVRVRLSELAI